jgi:hypothetical protein
MRTSVGDVRQKLAVSASALAVLVAVGGCGAHRTEVRRDACDDSVTTTGEVPSTMHSQGVTRGVGAGSVWFIDPGTPRWSDRVEKRDGGAWAKLPLWVGSSRLPDVTVVGVHGTKGKGGAEMTPTSDGLPGPVPMGVTMPGPGCWRVTATGQSGSASITVNAVLS